jgi:hypothetical protein
MTNVPSPEPGSRSSGCDPPRFVVVPRPDHPRPSSSDGAQVLVQICWSLLVADGRIDAAFLQDGLADIMRGRVRRRRSRVTQAGPSARRFQSLRDVGSVPSGL